MPLYGIYQEKDLAPNALASSVDRETLLDMQFETLATHQADIYSLVSLFCDRTTLSQLSVRSGGSNRLQPLDEYGRPRPVKERGQYIIGLPLWKAGTAEGWNFWVSAEMTVEDYANSLSLMLTGDVTWVRDQILAPLFYAGAGFGYVDPKRGESLTVYGLANGDGTVYDKSTGAAIDSHYSAQAAAIDAANNPFPAIYDELTEHPLNGGRLVAFINPTNAAAVRLLPGFAPVDDQMINIVPATGGVTTDPLFSPTLNLPLPRSMRHIGTINNTYVVTWQNMPAGYMTTVAVDAQEKPLAMRESAVPQRQGFINMGEPMAQFPYQQVNWVRQAGFGARNRTAAHVHYFGTSGTYAAPAFYPFPLA